jgi:hypothetical protein
MVDSALYERLCSIENSIFDGQMFQMFIKFQIEWLVFYNNIVEKCELQKRKDIVRYVRIWTQNQKKKEGCNLAADQIQFAREYLLKWVKKDKSYYNRNTYQCYLDTMLKKYENDLMQMKTFSNWLKFSMQLDKFVSTNGTLCYFTLLKGLFHALNLVATGNMRDLRWDLR